MVTSAPDRLHLNSPGDYMEARTWDEDGRRASKQGAAEVQTRLVEGTGLLTSASALLHPPAMSPRSGCAPRDVQHIWHCRDKLKDAQRWK